MNDFARKIQNNISKKKQLNGKALFEDICYGLTKNTNIGLSDLIEAPTPLVISLAKSLEKSLKAEERAMKKKR